jgi:hypothetical protein
MYILAITLLILKILMDIASLIKEISGKTPTSVTDSTHCINQEGDHTREVLTM